MRRKTALALSVLFVLILSFSALAQEKTGPSVIYKKNADGSFERLEARGQKVRSVEALRDMKAALEAKAGVYEKLAAMTPEELASAHATWERFRDPVTKGQVTIPQAVENMKRQWDEEKAAIEAALK